MAIQFNADALSRFSNVNFGDNDAIANLDGGNGLVQNEKLGFILTRKFRSSTAERQNNAVRTELLKSLGRAFGLTGFNEDNDTFTDQFMNRLEEILGPAFKRGDYGITNGVVDSGKPLTQRRIQAVYNAATAYASENGAVNNVGAVANQANGANIRKFQDVSALLCGRDIAQIVGDNRDEGWEERAGDLAVLTAKVKQSALTIVEDNAYAKVTHKGIEVELHIDNGQIKANVTIGEETHPVANLSVTREKFCFALDEMISSLYDSFAEKKNGDLTCGRAVLADKVLGYYKDKSKDDLYTKANCPLRNFASGLLMTKAKVAEDQIAKLTNSQLADFVTTLCQTGDAPATKELVASTIEEADEDDRKLEEEVNEHVQRQNEEEEYANNLDGDFDDNEQIVEKEEEPSANDGKYININEI